MKEPEKIELVAVEVSEKPVLRRLLELYCYDFSEYDQADVNAHGFYGYEYLDYYWMEEARHPFFIKVNGQFAGLVLVSEYCYAVDEAGARSITEFFVMRKYRRRGVGRVIAREVFDLFPGKWEVDQYANNLPSIYFWETVIGEYTSGNFEKCETLVEGWPGQALIFDNSRE